MKRKKTASALIVAGLLTIPLMAHADLDKTGFTVRANDSSNPEITATAGLLLDTAEGNGSNNETDPEESAREGLFTYMCDNDQSIVSLVSQATNGTVTWSDGTTETKLAPAESFQAKAEVEYTVEFDGTVGTLGSSGASTTNCLRSVNEWPNGVVNLDMALAGESNLTSVPSDLPSEVTSLYATFAHTSNLNDPNLGSWDMKNVKSISWAFAASGFSQDLSRWTTSNIEDMSYAFTESSFNGDISSWDVSNTTNMSGMFSNNKSFNKDISLWNTGNVENMASMFNGTSFNGEISGWDVRNVVNMSEMFAFTPFNQDISGWQVPNVENHYHFAEEGNLNAEFFPDFPS